MSDNRELGVAAQAAAFCPRSLAGREFPAIVEFIGASGLVVVDFVQIEADFVVVNVDNSQNSVTDLDSITNRQL